MRNLRQMNSSLLLAMVGVIVPASTAFAQQWGQDAPAGPAGPSGQSSPASGAASQSGSTKTSGMALKIMDVLITAYPSVQLELQNNDNLYSTPIKRTSDQIVVLKPAMRLETRQAANSYSLNIGATVGQYQRSTADNYADYNFNGLANLDLATRLRVRLTADYMDGHDFRGSNNNALSDVPDRYHSLAGRGLVSYGALGARGRIEFELGQLRRQYYNNRAITAASDSNVSDAGATFYWRIGPKTELLFQGKHGTVKYALSSLDRDSSENRYLAGAIWEATEKTRGTFRIGMVKKDFNVAARRGSTSVTWEGQIRWNPRTYSHVDVNLLKTPAETTGGVGNFVDSTSTGAIWTHEWTNLISTAASATYLTSAYEGISRKDNTLTYGVKATYKMRRWLSFGGDYSNSSRSSSDSSFDYKRNLFLLFVNATL